MQLSLRRIMFFSTTPEVDGQALVACQRAYIAIIGSCVGKIPPHLSHVGALHRKGYRSQGEGRAPSKFLARSLESVADSSRKCQGNASTALGRRVGLAWAVTVGDGLSKSYIRQ